MLRGGKFEQALMSRSLTVKARDDDYACCNSKPPKEPAIFERNRYRSSLSVQRIEVRFRSPLWPPQAPRIPKGGLPGQFILEEEKNVSTWDLLGDLVMSAKVVAHAAQPGHSVDLTDLRCGSPWCCGR